MESMVLESISWIRPTICLEVTVKRRLRIAQYFRQKLTELARHGAQIRRLKEA